ncbi:DMT family transporter [Chitinibacteraceae bacterium HSL-7]
MSEVRSARLAVAFALLSATGFASKAVFAKLAYRYGVDAITLLMLRLLGVVVCLMLIRMWRKPDAAGLSWQDRGWLLLLGMLGYYLASVFDFIGLETVSASIERLLLYLYPTLTVLLSAWWFGHAITRRMWVALVLTYAGIALVLGSDVQHVRLDWTGVAWIIASTLSFACYLTLSPKAIKRMGALRFTEGALLVSAGMMAVHFVLARPVTALIQPAPVYAYVAAMAVFATVLPVYLMNMAVGQLGAGRAAVIGSIGPVLTIIMSMSVLDESLSALQWLGAAVVLSGVALVGREKKG